MSVTKNIIVSLWWCPVLLLGFCCCLWDLIVFFFCPQDPGCFVLILCFDGAVNSSTICRLNSVKEQQLWLQGEHTAS